VAKGGSGEEGEKNPFNLREKKTLLFQTLQRGSSVRKRRQLRGEEGVKPAEKAPKMSGRKSRSIGKDVISGGEYILTQEEIGQCTAAVKRGISVEGGITISHLIDPLSVLERKGTVRSLRKRGEERVVVEEEGEAPTLDRHFEESGEKLP